MISKLLEKLKVTSKILKIQIEKDIKNIKGESIKYFDIIID